MSELKDFIKNNKLGHNETAMIEKEQAKLIKDAFEIAGMKEYKYIPYTRRNMAPQAKALFPKSATSLDALIISPFTKNDLLRIAELAETDAEIQELIKEWEEDATKQEPCDYE